MHSGTTLGQIWPGQTTAPLSDRSTSDHPQPRLLPISNAHSEGQSHGGVTMTGAIEGSSGSGVGNSSGSGSGLSNSHQYLSSPPRPPPRQTSSSSYANSALGAGGSSSSTTSSPIASNHFASSSGHKGFSIDYSPVSSQWGAIGSSAAASNSSEDFFFQRDPLLLPRRNHTIGAGPTTSNRRRLDSHFQFPSQGPTSPGQNSLSAITGGQDADDDDWENMIKSRDKLVPDEDDGDETITRIQGKGRTTAAASAWQPGSTLFTASHHRFSSQPSSAQAASPYYSATHSPVSSSDANSNLGHQRSESAHVRSLEHGPFASASTVTSPSSHYSNIDAGMIRRHQSLNHATGRATANRLQASTRRNINDRQNVNQRSPVDFFDHPASISPSFVPVVSGRATPEANAAMSNASIMDAHARLARMTLQPSHSIREDSLDSNATAKDIDAKKKLPSLITNREVLEKSAAISLQGNKSLAGPVSAAPYVPPIGHGHHRRSSSSSNAAQTKGEAPSRERVNKPSLLQGPYSAMPVSNSWAVPGLPASTKGVPGQGQQPFDLPRDDASLAKQAHLTSLDSTAMSIAMLQQRLLQQSAAQAPLSAAQLLQHQQALQNGIHSAAALLHASGNQSGPLDMRQNVPLAPIYGTISGDIAPPASFRGYPTVPFLGNSLPPHPAPAPSISPALASLIAARGYNPTPMQFDLNPSRARFFVIKSFTEDDVQRSLKYEIWASTDKGNQRLDKAYKECQEEGGIPLYLFFSVNASGHFCGMAQMMTALDYNSSSNVWVQEGKWKGTFKVKWIYVKDVPNVKLRHICLTNTPERKPVTQSRDTQELPTDGGKEVLRIMAEYQSKTTLLQDWLFYEQQALQQQQRKDNGEATMLPTEGPASTQAA